MLWRIATDTRDHEAHDLTGKGAEHAGGRWNRPGRPVVYAASSIALACLETIVHVHASGLPLNRFLVRIDVPDELWARRRILNAQTLPVGWSAIPQGRVSLDVGDGWLQDQSAALLAVPSVIVPEEFNLLVNPRHASAMHLRAVKTRPWFYDQRLS